MAYDKNQNEKALPGASEQKKEATPFLPRFFRTESNEKFINATLDQFIQNGAVEKINSYLGRETARSSKNTDSYLGDISRQRKDYQLEPASVIIDDLENVTYYKDYNDYLNQVKIFNSTTSNYGLLNQQETYSWNPNIDWDKFVNFREYYWLPNGPDAISIFGQQDLLESTYTVELADEIDNQPYIFNPNGLTRNPTINLYRGQIYKFEVDTPDAPLFFQVEKREGQTYRYDKVTNNGAEQGVITVIIDEQTPDTLYYVNGNDLNQGGQINVLPIEENSFIDVENEIIGKKEYTLSNGEKLSNGMKLEFLGRTNPEKYSEGFWYVEGVGNKIELVSSDDLEIPATYTQSTQVPFDEVGFDTIPFGNQASFAGAKDYILICRSAVDRSPWSRYNRWFHIDVLEKTAKINGTELEIDQSARAFKPIIEFTAGLKLFNFGTKQKTPVTVVDTFTTDVFSIIEGSQGYNIDGVDLVEGMRVLFTADTDSRVYGKIYRVTFIDFRNQSQISLVEETDAEPIENETVLVKQGTENQGVMWFYDGNQWKPAQRKNNINQAPHFDLFDSNDVSLSDNIVYGSTNFEGNNIFSYAIGTGSNDEDLGFPLKYQTIENTGDILFDFNYLTETYTYTVDKLSATINSKDCFVRVYDRNGNYKLQNAWQKSKVTNTSFVIRQYYAERVEDLFEVDVFENAALLDDLKLVVYKNNSLVFENVDYITISEQGRLYLQFNNLSVDDKILIKARSSALKTDNGYYEIASNLERNPANSSLPEFSYGEVIDHVLSIAEEHPEFSGVFPGKSNLRDLQDATLYGKKVIQHSSPFNLAAYHLLDADANAVKAIRFAKNEYSKFKRNFIKTITDLPFNGNIKEHVDNALKELNLNKNNAMPFYFSDMVPYKGFKSYEYVLERGLDTYPFYIDFDINTVSDKALLVYLDDNLLVIEKDYIIQDEFIILQNIDSPNSVLRIFEYETTNGNFVPPTPTKFGLYPKFEPMIVQDKSYPEAVNFIQGHDGSLIRAYDDYRDDIILELEKRIFNNIKVQYNTRLLDYDDFQTTLQRKTEFANDSANVSLSTDYGQWIALTGLENPQENIYFNANNPFTFNYGFSLLFNGESSPGFWRGIYKYVYETDRPNTHPWEILGFTIKPLWWEDQYGPAPYTSDNKLLWEDLSAGIIRNPNARLTTNKKRAKPFLINKLPVDGQGNLKDPIAAGLIKNFDINLADNDYKFSDISPVESAWRKSSEYAFSLLLAYIVNQPHHVFASSFDRSRQKVNKIDQIVYENENQRITLDELVFPNVSGDTEKKFTAGIVNYVQNYLTSKNKNIFESYASRLSSITNRISAKIAGFTSKENFRLILDSRTPLNQGNVFVPEENFNVILNSSSPTNELVYSGVIIEKKSNGFVVKGYNKENTNFYVNDYLESIDDKGIVIGGVTADFSNWNSGVEYAQGEYISYQNSFYKALNKNSSSTFNSDDWQKIPALPEVGGARATIRRKFRNEILVVPYGTLFATVQEVVDFLLGYEYYLKSQGFEFDAFSSENSEIENWKLSVKEFLFWTTQNWDDNSVLTLSPAANSLVVKQEYAVIDSILNPFYGYSILKADGRPLDSTNVKTVRNKNNKFTLKTVNTNEGIYFAKLYPVQKEHVVIFDNETKFKDVIYSPAMGYRQERIRVLGYRTDEWSGDFNVPGFIYDNVTIKKWEPFTDYNIGDTVKFKEFYYSAKFNISGSQSFDTTQWVKLPAKPEASLLPNFDYKVAQFGDFYDLESDNFDSEQQRLAQHLVGYQKRQYLENIINDEVSQYKFYQGMIREKGTLNSLTKLFESISAAGEDSLKFYEEWAVRVGQYGGVSNFKEVEYIIDEQKYILEPQPVSLVAAKDTNTSELIYQQVLDDVYTKPDNYDHKPFVTRDDYNLYLKTTGYVAEEDVEFTIKEIEDISTIDFRNTSRTGYVWVANYTNDWAVLKPSKTNLNIVSAENNQGVLTLTLNKQVKGISKNDYILIRGVVEDADVPVDQTINKAWKVLKVNNNTIDIETDIAPSEESIIANRAFVAKFTNYRIKDANTFNSDIITDFLLPGDKVWFDDIGDSNWALLENQDLHSVFNEFENPSVYRGELNTVDGYDQYDVVTFEGKKYQASTAIPRGLGLAYTQGGDPVLSENWFEYDDYFIDRFGASIAADKTNQNIFLGSPRANIEKGEVYYYQRNGENLTPVFVERLKPINDYAVSPSFGEVLSISEDGNVLVVGAPNSSGVKTRFKGIYDGNETYSLGDIVEYDSKLWKVTQDTVGDGSTITVESQDFEEISYIPADFDGTAYITGTNTTEGIIFVYQKVGARDYRLRAVSMSRVPAQNEKFGSEIQVITADNNVYTILVGTDTATNDVIYEFSYNITDESLSYVDKIEYDFDYNFKTNFDINATGDVLAVGIDGFDIYDNSKTYPAGSVVVFDDKTYITETEIQPLVETDLILSGVKNPEFSASAGTILSQLYTNATGVVKNDVNVSTQIRLTNVQEEFQPLQVIEINNQDSTFIIPQVGQVLTQYKDNTGITTLSGTVLSVSEGDTFDDPILVYCTADRGTAFDSNEDLISDDSTVTIIQGSFTATRNDFLQATGSDSTELSNPRRFITAVNKSFTDNIDAWTPTSKEQVIVYRKVNGVFEQSDVITAPAGTNRFGSKLSISPDGKRLVIGAPGTDGVVLEDKGKIFVYDYNVLTDWTLSQTLDAPQNFSNQNFGEQFTYDGDRLYAVSKGGQNFVENTFTDEFTLDGNFTRIGDLYTDYTNFNIYENINGQLVFSGKLDLDPTQNAKDVEIFATNNHVYIGAPFIGSEVYDLGKVYDIRRPSVSTSWNTLTQANPLVDLNKIKKVFLYNKKTKELLSEIDYIDPLQGKIAAPIEQDITFKTYYDPAVYSQGTGGVVVDTDQSWGSEKEGLIWWNLSTSKFYNPYQKDIIFKSNYWNTLFPGFEVEICEWVSTDLLPSEWNELSGTTEGFAQGISGTAKYNDNTYSVSKVYNREAGSFSDKYHYWVINKTTRPDSPVRNYSASEIADLIRDPAGQGYRFVALLGESEFAIYNCKNLLSGKDVVLSFQYYTQDREDINIHSEYKIITEGLETSTVPEELVQKWFDSLIGLDKNLRSVPDINLSEKKKYGTLSVPRQGMFKNRFEARKQFFERVNNILLEQVIIDDFDLSKLLEKDSIPNILENKYDEVIENIINLENINISNTEPAEISAVLEDGKISRVNIINSGRGYQRPPTIIVNGNGYGAELKAEITNGRVTNVIIRNRGKGYETVNFTMRPYSVLVQSDPEINNQWAIYAYDYNDQEWKRTISQSFDNTLYWNYQDWYEEGFSSLTSIDLVLDQTYELFTNDISVGDIVKIENIGTGGWILLQKTSNTGSNDTTIDFKTVGRQNGTIQFLERLWNYTQTQTGFDLDAYDTTVYDTEPYVEIRNILEALYTNIFVDNLSVHWNDLFFVSLRYAFSEQQYVDWAFKTSFVKAEHRLGELAQKVNFENDNLASYEDYVKEVKPFKTKIREYLSTYEKVENTNTLVTDFDLVPVYNPDTDRIEPKNVVVRDGELYASQPFTLDANMNWLDNVGFEVAEIEIKDPGHGYIFPPKVTITGGGGAGATAQAFVNGGKLVRIKVLKPGSGYKEVPNISIDSPNGLNARNPVVVVRLGNQLTRSINSTIKFDRISDGRDQRFILPDLKPNELGYETFVGSATQTKYKLKHPMDLNILNVNVEVDGVELLRSEFTYGNEEDNSGVSYIYDENYQAITSNNEFTNQIFTGLTKYNGYIVLTNTPAQDSVIKVTYLRNLNSLDIANRIKHGYYPTAGMLGNDLAQLMDGVDYGGVQVDTYGFFDSLLGGWDENGWGEDTWAPVDGIVSEDIDLYFEGSTYSFTLPTGRVLENGVEYNVYITLQNVDGLYIDARDAVRVDDSRYDGPGSMELTDNPIAFMKPVIGDGSSTFTIPDPDVFDSYIQDSQIPTLGTGVLTKITLRKADDDGSILPDDKEYDTLLTGGDLAYSSATGVDSGDIVIDGDGFVTPTTSKGPEEIIPGHVSDTLDLKVYHRVDDGSSLIGSSTYFYNGSNNTFTISLLPSKDESMIVKVNNNILDSSNYEIDYTAKTVTITSPLVTNDLVSILTLTGNGSGILDADTFIADGSTNEYITNVLWYENINSFVTINGQEIDYRIFETGPEYGRDAGRVGIIFGSAPQANDVIYFILTASEETPISQVSIEQFTGDGSTDTFTLQPLPFTLTEEIYTNVLVNVNGIFLNQGYSKKFIVNNSLNNYQLDLWQITRGQVTLEQLKVFLNNSLLQYETDYEWYDDTNTIRLVDGVGNDGDSLKIYALGEEEFEIDTSNGYNLVLDTAPLQDQEVTVYVLGDDRTQNFERYHYDITLDEELEEGSTQLLDYQRIKSGYISLRSKPDSAEYVWLFVNGKLLTPNFDYTLDEGRRNIVVRNGFDDNDKIEVLEFGSKPIGSRFGYKIFKDMTNRYIYKRLSSDKKYKLAQPLNYYDQVIVLNNSEGLPSPSKDENIPGVVFIGNERIEYLIKTDNVLRQLRRGTRGTGIKDFYDVDTVVFDQSLKQTVPYNDNIQTVNFDADGTTNEFILPYITRPTESSINGNWYRDSIPENFGQCDEIEVFLGGRRLRKAPYVEYDLATDSDITYEAEFSVQNSPIDTNNPASHIRITLKDGQTSTELDGQRITVVRRTGVTWTNAGESLAEAENTIARFLRAESRSLPK